jgi:cytidine deaminase
MQQLLAAALQARDHAFAPYSNFRVGAAVEDFEGRIFSGCNVESASYGLTICGERNAIFQGVTAGSRRFRRVLVVVDTPTLTPPCGACRQVLHEFLGPEGEVILCNLAGARESFLVRDLLPRAFDGSLLG